jgi:hypothetical protein
MYGKALFSGSKFVFWSLTPFVILFALIMTFAGREWTLTGIVITVIWDSSSLLLILGLWNPRRFHWAHRSASGVVFGAYLLYLIDESWGGKGWNPPSSPSEPAPFNALFGLLIIGIPCLKHTLFGAFSPESQNTKKDRD